MANIKNNINIGLKIDPQNKTKEELEKIISNLSNNKIVLDVETKGNIYNELKNISELIDIIKSKSNDNISLDSLNTSLKSSSNQLNSFADNLKKIQTTELGDNLARQVETFNNGIGQTVKVSTLLQNVDGEFIKVGNDVKTITNDIEKYNLSLDKIKQAQEKLSNMKFVDKEQVQSLKNMFDNKEFISSNSELNKYLNQVKELEKEEKSIIANKQKESELNTKLANIDFLSIQKSAYNELNRLLNEEYSIKTKLINAGKKESEVLEQQLIANKLNQQAVNTNINSNNLNSRQRDIELTNQQIKLQEQLNLSKSKKIDDNNSKAVKESEAYKKEQQQVKELINQQTRLLEIKKQSLNRQYGDKIDVSSIDQAIQKLRSMNNSSLNGVRSEIKNTNISIKELEENVKSSEGIFSRLGNVLGNFGIYLDIGSVIGTFTNSIRSAYDYISYLDSSFTDMNMTMSISKNQFEAMSSEIDELSKSLGITIEDAHDIGKLLPILYSNI